VAAIAGYLAMAVLVTARLWRDPTGRVSGANASDQTLFEWMLAHAARSVTHLENPLLSTRMSTPSGINIIANTSVLGLGVPLTPVTLAWGPSVTYLVVITIALAGTATAWYLVLSRYVTTSRLAAFAGAGFCAFAPGMISQAAGHPHMAAQFLVPLIIWGVFRLRDTTRPVRHGLILGTLIAYQVFIGEEVLFVVALVCAVCVLAYAAFRRREAFRSSRQFATGLGVAALVAVALVGYPLYVQFFGPQSYRRIPDIEKHGADLLAYGAYSPLTFGGDPGARLELARNPTELNSFFGWPLLLLTVAMVWWLRRHLAVRLAAIVAAIFAVLSLGHDLRVNGEYTGIPGPWRLLVHAPLFESVVTTRLGMVVAAAIGVIIAAAVQELRKTTTMPVPARIVWAVCVVAALLPLTPRPLPATGAVPVPAALANGGWREYLSGDGALMPIPPTKAAAVTAMRWSAAEGLGFRVTHGYFPGPDPTRGGGWATFSTPPTQTDRLLTDIAKHGVPVAVTEQDRAQARADLRLRGAGLLVMSARERNGEALRATVDALVGPGRRAGDVWLWEVRLS
jgi:hypothetical protein